MDRASLLFCSLSLAASLLVAVIFFPFASISTDRLAASRTPTPAYEMGSLELDDFGEVSVQEMVDYYVENPPTPSETGAAPERQVRFQGC